MYKHIEIFRQIGKVKKHYAGNVLFYQGDMPTHFLVILSGKVGLYKNEAEKEIFIHYCDEKSLIAEMPTFLNIAYPASAVCECDCEIIYVERQLFLDKLKNMEFCISFILSLCQKIRIIEQSLTQQTQNLTQRLAHFLLQSEMNAPLSQIQIAKKLNTSPQALSRCIKSLKNTNAIRLHKGKIIEFNKNDLLKLVN